MEFYSSLYSINYVISLKSNPEEIKKVQADGRFICGNPNCGAISFRMKQKLKNCMAYPYIYSEEELRHLVLNALIERDATVWNCKWKSCLDPIPVEGIPMWLIGEILFSIIPKFEKIRKPVK